MVKWKKHRERWRFIVLNEEDYYMLPYEISETTIILNMMGDIKKRSSSNNITLYADGVEVSDWHKPVLSLKDKDLSYLILDKNAPLELGYYSD